jgi:tetratricopeptide (TPR) repeat protein
MRKFQLKVRLTTVPSARALVAALVLAAATTGCGDRRTQAYAEAQAAQALLDAGDLPGARAAMQRALRLRDDELDLILLDGRIKYQMNDIPAAYNAFSLALAIDPVHPEALMAVSQLGMSLGADREATAATEQILTMDPNNAQALMIKGLQTLGKRDYPGTLAISDRLLAADPRSEAGLVLKARALSLMNKREEALATLRGAAERIGPSRMITTALLENARDQGDGALMLEQFQRMRELVPKNVDLTIDEANVLYKLGRRDPARERGWALIVDNGQNVRAMQRLTDLWAEYDPAPLTSGQLQELASQGPPIARLAVARYYLGRGDTATAKELVGSMLGAEPNGLRVRIGYAAGEPGAERAAEQVLEQDTTNCDALAVRSLDAIKRGRPNEAVTAAQQITSECPDGEGYELLARAYRARNNDVGARRAFLEGARDRPLATEPVARYVAWLTARGELDDAVNNARSLTQRAPAKLSAWKLFKATCARAGDAVCAAEAAAGEAAARRNYAIDLPPGERRPSPLLGNTWR